MKKKRLFSRIFAAVLAVAIAAVTLITNSGAGLSVFADGEEAEATAEDNGSEGKYSVKIISPDVPADGKTYSYNFYQIIAGEVEADGDVNIIANPKWGEALGGKDFDKVPEGKTPVGGMAYDAENAGIGYYPTSEVLLTALSGTMSCEYYDIDSSGAKKGPVLESAYDEYCKILNSYGVSYKGNTNYTVDNYFYKKFRYDLEKNYNNTGSEKCRFDGKTRDVKGLVELLNEGSTNGNLKTVDLRAFADLLLNGVKVKVKTDTEGTTTDYTYEFITGEPQVRVDVTSKNGDPYEVTGLNPGYYLVTCVGADDNLSNNGYETSVPVKPVSTMLILVGPANGGVTEIVGKNAYSVPTVTLDMYQKPVQLDVGEYGIKTGTYNCNASGAGGYDHDVVNIGTIITDNKWQNTGSFDYYGEGDRNEAILYRIGITLPQNFDQYKDSGYFLAVLDQYSHFGVFPYINRETDRVANVRPYVYVKRGDQYKLVGRCQGNASDNKSLSNTVGEAIIGITYESSNIAKKLTNDISKTIYNKNDALGSDAHDMFCFGNLYDYKTIVEDSETGASNEVCIFNPGDTIYIYYPAILMQANVFNSENYLLNANRVWAVYSNNPYAKGLTSGSGYSHAVNGEVGVTPIAEANVNTYGVTLKVEGEAEYSSGAKFALYRVVTDSAGNKTKEYAYAPANKLNSWVKKWIPESELYTENMTIEDALLNYSENSRSKMWYAYLASDNTGILKDGMKIKGLAAGEYYLQELTISSNGVDSNNKETDSSGHDNLKKYHYERAKEPIKFNIGNEYYDSVNGYLGKNDNKKTFISKLTVDFLLETPERAIDTYIYKPDKGVDTDNKPVPEKNGSITTMLKEDLTTYATEDGQIEIRVYHKTINLIWLPETGGIGTMIFFIVGGTIVMAAVVMIITRFRVKRERL